ncbi:hypothetical protein ACKRZS_001782 [Fusarium odoratissimum]
MFSLNGSGGHKPEYMFVRRKKNTMTKFSTEAVARMPKYLAFMEQRLCRHHNAIGHCEGILAHFKNIPLCLGLIDISAPVLHVTIHNIRCNHDHFLYGTTGTCTPAPAAGGAGGSSAPAALSDLRGSSRNRKGPAR